MKHEVSSSLHGAGYSSHERRNSNSRTKQRANDKRRERSSSTTPPRSPPRVKKPTKEKRHRSRRRRSKSESSGAADAKLEAKLERERVKRKEERHDQKTLMKRTESVEEKRARRLAKKMAKQNKLKEERGWHEDCMDYSNVDNPFGDPNLTETFVWGKKLEREGITNVTMEELNKMHRQRLEESKDELDKAKRSRMERERLKEERDNELELIQRDNEAKLFTEWSKSEQQFHLKQARLRSNIRIVENRAKPIDLLAHYISPQDDNELAEVEMNEAYILLHGLDMRDLEDLLEDIKVYQRLEKDINDEYWKDLAIVATEELQKLQKLDRNHPEYQGSNRRDVVNESVRKDISNILKGKNCEELALLETQIMKKLKGDEEGVDVGYWEALLAQLKIFMAKARLSKLHQLLLKAKLKRMQTQQNLDNMAKESNNDDTTQQPSTSTTTTTTFSSSMQKETGGNDVVEYDVDAEWERLPDDDKEGRMDSEYCTGSYSPLYLTEGDVGPAVELIDPIEDSRRLEYSRVTYKSSGPTVATKEDELEREARKGMNNEEASFAVEAPLEKKTYLWSEKYRPRKPRYFNRVHTGFEWNKYNQTHYDLDNPPPKIVQGYKFNIFYPDLLDPSKAPEFSLFQCKDNPDFAILKFHAGPPYEDIAFKIVNREWEAQHDKSFKNQFQNGIFQLWFYFKKYRYRR